MTGSFWWDALIGVAVAPAAAWVVLVVALVLAYLAFPVDLVPDVIPVLGYADDAIITVAVRAHWPGSEDGFAALMRFVRPRRLANP